MSFRSLMCIFFSFVSPRLSSGCVEYCTHDLGVSLDRRNMSNEDYRNAVLQAKEHILAGDIFQIVLSQRFERRTYAEPFEVYRALRVVNPSPYMTYLQVLILYSTVKTIYHIFISWRGWFKQILLPLSWQARGCILVASSPEILARVKKVKTLSSFLVDSGEIFHIPSFARLYEKIFCLLWTRTKEIYVRLY